MEDQDIQQEAAQPEVAPSYTILSFPSSKLPEQYTALIYSRWLRSLRFGNNLFKKIDSDQYYKHYHSFIEVLLAKPDSVTRLAVLSDDHDVVLGFAVYREDVLDYVHVGADYRLIGIATKLMPIGITTFTHITLTVIGVWPNHETYKHLKFNPFA